MTDVPFPQTRVGQRFYDVTMPKLVEQLERLKEHLERLVARVAPDAEPRPGILG